MNQAIEEILKDRVKYHYDKCCNWASEAQAIMNNDKQETIGAYTNCCTQEAIEYGKYLGVITSLYVMSNPNRCAPGQEIKICDADFYSFWTQLAKELNMDEIGFPGYDIKHYNIGA